MIQGGRSVASKHGGTDDSEARNENARNKKSRYRRKQQRKQVSEKIMRLEYNHHFKPTSGTRFHADHTYLCIGVMHITNGESSEVFCSCQVGGRGPERKGAPWSVMLRNVAEGARDRFWIHLG
jgi:hypothetical protein